MSQAANLTKEKLERLKLFLKNDSIEKCCDKFKIGSPAFREAISNTVKSLYDFYVRGTEHYIGSFTSTRDVAFNKEVILVWIKRCEKREKPNAVPECEVIEANEQEIMRGLVRDFPTKGQSGYGDDAKRLEGALWVLKNYRVTGKIK